MTQTAGHGLCGFRINPHRCLRTSSEIRAVGERDARILKGFRCRFSCLTPRVLAVQSLHSRFGGTIIDLHDYRHRKEFFLSLAKMLIETDQALFKLLDRNWR